MLSAVNPSSSGKGGGVFAPTGGSPVGVSDQILAPPGTNGFPTPSTGPVKEARNNRNSNEKVPYARLVPVRPSDQMKSGGAFAPLPASHGIQTALVDHTLTSEYQDLKPGELAWVRGSNVRHLGKKDAERASIHDFGMGPDRFQRLASTTWVERASVHLFGADVIDLRNLQLAKKRPLDQNGDPIGPIDVPWDIDDIVAFKKQFEGSTVVNSADVPYLFAVQYAQQKNNQTMPVSADQAITVGTLKYGGVALDAGYPFMCGINTTTTSPFLHGFMMDCSYKKVTRVRTPQEAEGTLHSVADEPPDFFYEFSRNFGDTMAFAALFAALRQKGFFSWSPDGLTMSKLASPADDQMVTEELDTRSGQLFNVAVAGNSIATTWTGDPEMPNMPGDGVYILLVADVETELSDAKSSKARDTEDEVKPGSHTDLAQKFVEAVKANNGTAIDAARTAATEGFIQNKPLLPEERKKAFEDIAVASQKVRSRTKSVARCQMTNFRWRRATSSYLANHSCVKVDSKHCRCGLGLGMDGDRVFGQYIVGAWRIGTVLDNAASRAGAPSMGVRTAPSSYAISVNVHVQWVSGDDLFRKYDGRRPVGVGLVGRGEHETEENDVLHQYTPEDVTPGAAEVQEVPMAAPAPAPAPAPTDSDSDGA